MDQIHFLDGVLKIYRQYNSMRKSDPYKGRYVIYKIYWPGKAFYIGKTKGFRKRRNRHLREMIDGTHHNKRLIKYRSMWGAPKFKIIFECNNWILLSETEREFLLLHSNNKRCCNVGMH